MSAQLSLESDRGRDEFVATFFLHSLLDDEDLAWLAHFTALNLTTDEARALVHVREAGQISNSVYRDLNGVDTLEASAHLRRLRDFKLLKQHDRGAATYYTPTERCLRPDEEPGKLSEESDNLREKPGNLREKPGNLREKPGNLREKPGNLPKQPSNLGKKPSNLPKQPSNLREKPGNLGERSSGEESGIEALMPPDLAADVARLNQWTPQPELRLLIQRICAWRPMSVGELASLLNRSRMYLRTFYIKPMVQAGELRFTNPGKPNDPAQRYRSDGSQVDP